MGDFVEDLAELVNVVDERELENDDDNLELKVFGKSISSCLGLGGVDSLLRDGPGCGVDSLLRDDPGFGLGFSVCVPASMVVWVPTF